MRLIDENGVQVGVVPTDTARRMALERGFDLVEISPTTNPPVCKLMNYGKYKYELKKKSQETKKKQHIQHIKELQLRPITEEHDVQVRLKHATEFLKRGDKVVVKMFFRGRELAHMELGQNLLNRFIKELEPIAKLERPVARLGKILTMTLLPK